MYRRCISATAACLLVFAAGFGLRAQEPPRGWKPPMDGRPVLILRTAAYSFANLVLENEFFGFVVAQTFRPSGGLCPSGMTVGVSPGNLKSGDVAWHVEGRLVELRPGEATFDLKWARQVNRGDISPADAFSSEQRVTLREGESRMLDLVRTTAPTAECDTFGLIYELRFDGPEPLSDAAIAYELWLVQHDADGELVTDRYKVTAQQGQQVDYFFQPLRFTSAGRRTTSGAEAIVMNVWGNIRGRVRGDGDIDLTVTGMRGFRDLAASAQASGHGRSLVTVKPGETIDVELNLPSAGLPKLGHLNQVFANHRTGVRVTAKRLW